MSAFTPRVFPDAQGSEFAREIDTLTTYRILSGFEDGTFRPKDTLTRAQFCAMIASALDLNTSAGKPAAFADVEEGAWYAGPVSASSPGMTTAPSTLKAPSPIRRWQPF